MAFPKEQKWNFGCQLNKNNKMLRAILIDDEENSLNALMQKLTQHCPLVEIIATYTVSAEAVKGIDLLRPDIVFLDIEMPGLNGFNLLQQVQYKNFEPVFVTAYDHYAVRAIRYSALDYLVKPVDIAELKSTVERALAKKNDSMPNQRLELLLDHLSSPIKHFKRIAIPSHDGLQFIKVSDIIYLEANVNYTHIYQAEHKYVVSRTIKDFEELLPADTFIRIHNSYIINKDYLEKYIRGEGGQVVLSTGVTLDVAKRKKADFLKAIGY
jgi:two-component system, LytTR family, response regulator